MIMGLVERHSRTSDLTHWRGAIPVNYVYTMGRSGEAFFRAVQKGKLLAATCSACSVTYLPPRIYCERCFARLEDAYAQVPAQGKVHTFTICHKRLDGTPSDSPLLLAMIRIDKTDGGLIHYLGKVKPEAVYVGMPVKGVFKPKKDRVGSILDIAYFRPLSKA
jgi:uncharacterized OB-fold protein